MTAQEQQMLQGLVERINGTQLPEKDADAEQYLQQNLGRNPDAMYILAQTVLVQQYALTQAQKQLADAKAEADQLRQQAQQPKPSTSFLGSLLGRSEEPARPAPPPPPPPPQASYAQPQLHAGSSPPPPAYAPTYALRPMGRRLVRCAAVAERRIPARRRADGCGSGRGRVGVRGNREPDARLWALGRLWLGYGLWWVWRRWWPAGGGRQQLLRRGLWTRRSLFLSDDASYDNNDVAEDASYDDGSSDFDSGGDSFDV